ncbi:MAG TPA: hypothetical protein VHA37_03105, partial [Candidatus Saccharimonadales bacterium]|nr:hypothetical protein [Candidatus Saccharimonadales bacterium]
QEGMVRQDAGSLAVCGAGRKGAEVKSKCRPPSAKRLGQVAARATAAPALQCAGRHLAAQF